ncbi:hypothetical protein JTB14_038164 [Gonioctena quinquepunctata]|nr:hypothetical protein JTB14_038164 [Gonioctena quinquepunctata]
MPPPRKFQRKVAFSGKAKKEQLQAKKHSKGGDTAAGENSNKILKKDVQPSGDLKSKSSRYALQFFTETREELQKQKEIARNSLEPKKEKDSEVDGDMFFDEELDFPKRPSWDFSLGKEKLEAQEQKYFAEYVNRIVHKFNGKDLSVFELNLETWRQLWRVLEMSDIILFIVDIRYPVILFPPSLYDYVNNTLKKDFILVLNKIDLAPASLVVAWKAYFQEKYPNMHIVMFTTLPSYNLVGKQSNVAGLQVRRARGKIRMAAEGTQQILTFAKTSE